MRKTKRRKLNLYRALLVFIAAAASISLIAAFSRAQSPKETKGKDESSTAAPSVEAEPIALTTEAIQIEVATPTPEPVVEYKSLGEFTLTAYCPCVQCCGEWSADHPSRIGTDYVQKTASGTIPAQGRTIGVDTSVIPFGTVVLINGHEYVAEDHGGAINGNRIDIYFDSHDEALQFGRQTAEVYIKISEEE